MAHGTNAEMMKTNNKKLILNLIRQDNYSRVDLAREMKLTKATLSILTEEMLREGLIFEEAAGEDYSGVGRRPIYIRLREKARYVIGIGLTRSGYHTGLFDLGGNAVRIERHKYCSDNADDNIKAMAEIVERYKKIVPLEALPGIGVAVPGPLDYKTGTILNPPNFEVWHNCELSKKLSALCGLPVRLENIANAMAVAEQYFGCCRREKDFAYVAVDEGIGSGIVTNGRIYRSQRGYGNELGHISIDINGKECSCGNHGCLERYAAIPEILKGTGYESWKAVLDDNNESIIRKEAEYLSCGIVSLLNLFDLGTIVLGGSISEGGGKIAEIIAKTVNGRAISRHAVRVVMSEAGHERALAAASIALSEFFF
ncbi:MAG: ROK family transcriptional regulator [Clostridia bacterium]|nr:ROK family transcriptional regulator [Clostridia bacterium]